MQSYRKKVDPGAEIEAVMLTAENVGEVSNWCHGQIVEERDMQTNEVYVGLNLRDGTDMRRASQGDYVIKWKDLFFVGKPSRFEDMYEPTQ